MSFEKSSGKPTPLMPSDGILDVRSPKPFVPSVGLPNANPQGQDNGLPSLVAYIDFTLTYRFGNAGYRDPFAGPRETPAGLTMREVLGEEGFQERLPFALAALRGESVRFESAFSDGQNSQARMETHYIPDLTGFAESGDRPSDPSSNNQPSRSARGFFVLMQDVTARQKQEDALLKLTESLREQSEYLRSLLESSPDCIKTLDLEGHILTMTMRGQQVMEVDDFTTIRGASWLTLIANEDSRNAVRAAMDAARAGGTGTFRGTCPTLKGTPKWWDVVVVPLLGADGRPKQLLSISRDVTEQSMAADRERNRLNQLFQRTPAFMALLRGPNHVFEMANPLYLESVGHRDILGKPVAEALPEVVDQGFLDLLDYVYATGEPSVSKDVRVLLQRQSSGPLEETFVDPTYQPLRDESGRVYGILAHGVDVTERKKLEIEREQLLREARARADRESFLSEASRMLNASLDYAETLTTVARLIVPRFADWCAVDILDSQGVLQRVTVEHVDPDKAAWGRELVRRYPTEMDSTQGIAAVVNTGRASFTPRVTDEMLAAFVQDEEKLRLLIDVGLTSVIIVPLAVRDNIFGALSLMATRESDRIFTEDDLWFAQEIGQRAALAVENARLYEALRAAESKQRRIADTLQESMLLVPPTEDEFNGLMVDSHYEAAWDDALIGGDYIDAFRLDENKVAILVGDCTGKGLEAARFVAECQFMIRAYLREDSDDPSAALTRLNAMLLNGQRLDKRPENALTALAVAVINIETGQTLVTAGGAEPPLVYRDAAGRAEEVEIQGALLGVDAQAQYRIVELTLAPNDVIVLTTDGTTESRNKKTREFFGYDGLMRTVEEIVGDGKPLRGVAKAILGSARNFAGGALADDSCIVVARFTGRIGEGQPQPT